VVSLLFWFCFVFFFGLCVYVLSCVCGAVEEEDKSNKKKGRKKMKRKSNMKSK